MSQAQHDALDGAARDALRAPSVFNTQPWTWRIDGASLELRADWSRQLAVADPHGAELLLSCGAALHHARVALAAGGWQVEVERLRPSPHGDLLARICLTGQRSPDLQACALHAAIARRRTDRRPFADRPVPADLVATLETAAEAEGVHVHRVRLDQMPMLAIAVALAGADEMANPDYRDELMRWTNRPEWSHDGVPAATAVRRVPRRVPVRELAVGPFEGIPVDPGGDRGAVYLILYGTGSGRADWLRAGEALSAVLLTAVSRGLAVAPITDVLEVEHPRDLIRGLLPETSGAPGAPGGPGTLVPTQPYALVRCGYPSDTSELPEVPRRAADEVVQGPSPW